MHEILTCQKANQRALPRVCVPGPRDSTPDCTVRCLSCGTPIHSRYPCTHARKGKEKRHLPPNPTLLFRFRGRGRRNRVLPFHSCLCHPLSSRCVETPQNEARKIKQIENKERKQVNREISKTRSAKHTQTFTHTHKKLTRGRFARTRASLNFHHRLRLMVWVGGFPFSSLPATKHRLRLFWLGIVIGKTDDSMPVPM